MNEAKPASGCAVEVIVERLKDLMDQWRCTAKVLRPIDINGAVAHLECADELDQILRGDLSPIAKWSDPHNVLTDGAEERGSVK
jgi:hypothetical protein